MKIGIVGAGTMGSGIALSALYADLEVILYDTYEDARDKARAYIERFLRKKDRLDALAQLTITDELTSLKDCEVVIEAVIEDLEVKRTLLQQLDETCTESTIFATNTSTISVTQLATATHKPGRVVGMHFFNPAPVMKLVEVVRAYQTDDHVIQQVTELAQRLGKTPIVVRDTPGFAVNRVARPFYLESLRLVSEGIATPVQVDTVLQLAAGFRMGPFQLMDLIGLDVSLVASQSVYEQTFHEPRYRPSMLQAWMIHANQLGRKTGRGFYNYTEGGVTIDSPALTADTGKHWTVGYYEMTPLLERCKRAGHTLTRDLDEADLVLVDAAHSTVSPGQVGYDGTLLADAQVITVSAADEDRSCTEALMHGLGLGVVWLPHDAPGHILSRVVCQIINEAAFAVGEGVAEAEMIDTAMRLGVNYPAGPFEWAQQIGVARVIAVLDHLYEFYHEERYRVAPGLRRLADRL